MGRDPNEKLRGDPRIFRDKHDHTYPIPKALLDCEAYAVLTPVAAQLLFEMIAVHFHASAWEKQSAPFPFTWGQCRLRMAESTFTAARKQLLEAGFFETLGEDQGLAPGGPILYRASRRWITFQAPAAVRVRWAKQDGAKAAKTARDRRRRTAYRVDTQKKTYPEIRGRSEQVSRR